MPPLELVANSRTRTRLRQARDAINLVHDLVEDAVLEEDTESLHFGALDNLDGCLKALAHQVLQLVEEY